MRSIIQTAPASKSRLWAGRILTALAAAFLLFDGVMKLVKPPVVVKATVELGYPESTIVGIGVVLLVCTILYLIPRTSILGAVLLTGYLGGAVASNVRVGIHFSATCSSRSMSVRWSGEVFTCATPGCAHSFQIATRTEHIMKEIVTHFNFDGNCREAMEFYKKCFGAELFLMPFSEMPRELPKQAQQAKDRIMHASLTKGFRLLMAADTM